MGGSPLFHPGIQKPMRVFRKKVLPELEIEPVPVCYPVRCHFTPVQWPGLSIYIRAQSIGCKK